VRSPTLKLALAILLSIAVHSLLFLQGKPTEPLLSQHSIIHARLDKQDRELIQQEQVGQIAQQHNKQISEASNPSQTVQDEPLQQEASKAEEKSQVTPIISSKSSNNLKTVNTPAKDIPKNATQDTEIEELVEKVDVAVSQPKTQKNSQVSSDSRAQVEAHEGSEDPTYTSYRRVLKQYLGQRLEAKADFQGTVRLKIKLEYGSVATSVNIIESSGNLQIDNWAKTAALAANPYPRIPKEIGSTFEFSPTLQLGKTK
jgi:outer membrane biosynthesis protein TonB